VAFYRDDLAFVLFPYIGLLIIWRYLSFVVMLVELRADVRAALAAGGLESFVTSLSSQPGVRRSPASLFRSVLGMNVSHLTASERLAFLLRRPEGLLAPKILYFAATIMFMLVLLLQGALLFTPFEWIVGAGLMVTVCAMNTVAVAMTANAERHFFERDSLGRDLILSVILLLTNGIFLLKPEEVGGTLSD
jgi:hypothetical protein